MSSNSTSDPIDTSALHGLPDGSKMEASLGSVAATGENGLVWLELNNIKNNVGNLRGASIYHVVYQALLTMCPEDGKYTSCYGSENTPKKVTHDVWFEFHNGFQMVRRKENLEIFVERSQWPKHNDALRRLFIGSVAGTVQAATEDKKNCRTWTYNAGFRPARITHCNIGDFVSAKATGGHGIDVRFRSSSFRGHFDCVAILEATEKYVRTLMPEYKEALGGMHLDLSLRCLNKEVTKRNRTT